MRSEPAYSRTAPPNKRSGDDWTRTTLEEYLCQLAPARIREQFARQPEFVSANQGRLIFHLMGSPVIKEILGRALSGTAAGAAFPAVSKNYTHTTRGSGAARCNTASSRAYPAMLTADTGAGETHAIEVKDLGTHTNAITVKGYRDKVFSLQVHNQLGAGRDHLRIAMTGSRWPQVARCRSTSSRASAESNSCRPASRSVPASALTTCGAAEAVEQVQPGWAGRLARRSLHGHHQQRAQGESHRHALRRVAEQHTRCGDAVARRITCGVTPSPASPRGVITATPPLRSTAAPFSRLSPQRSRAPTRWHGGSAFAGSSYRAVYEATAPGFVRYRAIWRWAPGTCSTATRRYPCVDAHVLYAGGRLHAGPSMRITAYAAAASTGCLSAGASDDRHLTAADWDFAGRTKSQRHTKQR